MNEHPTIALLIPAYNAAAFLPRLLQSAMAQDPVFDEIWIHDDCSTDTTAAVGRALGAKVFTNPTNVGCTAGKAQLSTLTKCDWVHFHDADDELLPGFTAAVRTVIESNPGLDAIITGTEECAEDDPSHRAIGIPNRQLLLSNPNLFSLKYKVNAICGIYRRSFLLEHDVLRVNDHEAYNEDQAIQLNLVIAGARFECVSDVMVRSYKQSASMSQSNAAKCARSQMHVILRALDAIIDDNSRSILCCAATERLWAVVATAAANADFITAKEAAGHAVRAAPIPRSAGGKVFRELAKMNPAGAILFREVWIRLFKPSLRGRK